MRKAIKCLTFLNPRHRETEWAFDFKDAKEIHTAYREIFIQSTHTFIFIQEIRFTKKDDFGMSECYGRDTSGLVHTIMMMSNGLRYFQIFKPLRKTTTADYIGGKEFSVNGENIAAIYPRYQDFVSFKQSIDPDGKFPNHLINKLFQAA